MKTTIRSFIDAALWYRPAGHRPCPPHPSG